MPPLSHIYNFAEVLVGCFGYLLQPNKARRLSDLVGGGMTPPYRRGYAYSPRAALRALMHSTVILSQLPATTSALGQTQGRSVLNLVQNDNGDDDGVGESFHYSHLKFLLKYVTEGHGA